MELSERNRRWAIRGGAGLAALALAGGVVAAVDGTSSDTAAVTGLARAGDDAGAGANTAPAHVATTIPGFAPDTEAYESQAKIATGQDQMAAGAEERRALADSDAAASVASGGAAAWPAGPPPGAAAGSSAVPGPTSKVIKTATIEVEVGEGVLAGAVNKVAVIAERHGGYVEGTTTSTELKDAAFSQLTVRVPAQHFENARQDLRGIGRVKLEQLQGTDVTNRLVDFDARIRSLQSQEETLRTLMSRAQRIGEVLEVQGQLFNVRQQIEQLQAQRTQLDGQASLATLTVSIFEPGAASGIDKPEPASGLAASWSRALNGAEAVVGGMVVVVGYLLPVGLLGLVVLAGFRLRRRHPAEAPTAV